MKKFRYSLCLDVNTMGLIDEVARRNNVSRSAVVRMFLDLANHLPADRLQFSSPIPDLLGISPEVNNAAD